MREAGIALFADRLILKAQPSINDTALAEVAEHCAGPVPEPLVELWRTSFGGRLDYDLRVDLGGHDVALSFHELFYPDSHGYQDLWGWIRHEEELARTHQPDWSGRLSYLPIGGFEYLDRIYVCTTEAPDHGTVVCWQEGLPPGWELDPGDRAGPLATHLHALFGQLMLEHDPWESDDEAGEEMRHAIDGLLDSGDPRIRATGAELRRLVRATVLDWRTALEQGTLAGQARLRRLALERAAINDDLVLLQRIVAEGCRPEEEVGAGLTPIDVALLHEAFTVVEWLLGQRVPVDNCLRVGSHSVNLDLARNLLARGATVDAFTLIRAMDNEDVEVLELLAGAVQPSDDLQRLGPRLRMMAAQARIASNRAATVADGPLADRQRARATALTGLADRFDPTGRRSST